MNVLWFSTENQCDTCFINIRMPKLGLKIFLILFVLFRPYGVKEHTENWRIHLQATVQGNDIGSRWETNLNLRIHLDMSGKCKKYMKDFQRVIPGINYLREHSGLFTNSIRKKVFNWNALNMLKQCCGREPSAVSLLNAKKKVWLCVSI